MTNLDTTLREKFHQKFGSVNGGAMPSGLDTEKNIADFFLSEFQQVIDGKKIPKPQCSCNQDTEKCDQCAGRYVREAHNKALDDVLSMLKD